MTLMRVSEVASVLRVSPAAVYGWIRDGRITPIRIGTKVVRISYEEFDSFLKREETRRTR